jgi:hypothetical protein
LSELEGYYRTLIIAKALPVRHLKYSLNWIEDNNFIGKIKEFFVTDEDIKRSMLKSDDRSWIQNIVLQGLTILSFLPDKATEQLFANLMRIQLE